MGDPPARPGAGAIGGWLASGVERPSVQALRLDLNSLPVADWGPAKGRGFSLRSLPGGGWALQVHSKLLTEVTVAAPLGLTQRLAFTSFTGHGFGTGEAPPCGAGHHGTRLAAWSGFQPSSWTDEAINVEMGDGDYDLATCRAVPKRSLFGRAGAIVRGFVYALRVRERDDEDRPLESLVVFLPRAAMMSTGADPSMDLQVAATGPFTRLTFPLREASAGSTSLRISPVSMALWSRMRRASPVHYAGEVTNLSADLLVGIDVAWQKDDRLVSLSVALPKGTNAGPYKGLLAALP
jgi:hypothetical protein